MSVERIIKIVGYFALLGAISFAWIEIAGRVRSEITEKIKEEVKEAT